MAIEMSVVRGRVVLQVDADEPFVIGDVSRFTGYDPRTLQRIEAEKKIPSSTRDASGRRTWRAADILKIRDYRMAARSRGTRRAA